MNRAHSARIAALAALIAAMALTTAAGASPAAWKWRGADGRIVYSDLPPPPGARVTLLARLNGDPSAMTISPTRRASESPGAIAGSIEPSATVTRHGPRSRSRSDARRTLARRLVSL